MRVTHVYRRNISTITFGFSDEPKETVYGVMDSLGDRQDKSVESTYGDRVCREGVSRVVRTTKLQGTTGCHRKLMKIATGDEER
jgi:hypothetical protein